jgi:hypothetical protein
LAHDELRAMDKTSTKVLTWICMEWWWEERYDKSWEEKWVDPPERFFLFFLKCKNSPWPRVSGGKITDSRCPPTTLGNLSQIITYMIRWRRGGRLWHEFLKILCAGTISSHSWGISVRSLLIYLFIYLFIHYYLIITVF